MAKRKAAGRRKGKAYRGTVTIPQLLKLAKRVTAAGSMAEAADILERFYRRLRGSVRERGTWKNCLAKMVAGLRSGRYWSTIFTPDGNSKLPFYSFSTAPIVTCPGYGACGTFCYSFKGWRYPAVFCRQLQNTLLILFDRRAIIEAFKAIPPGWLRLYVDGDIDSESTAILWWNLLRQRPDINCFGYSKSWPIILRTAAMVPSNYVLNVSGGSRYDNDDEMRQRMLALPFVRGEFICPTLDGEYPSKGFERYDLPEYHADVRRSAARDGYPKVFSCGGQCGDCSNRGPVCGLVDIKLPVANGLH